MADSKNIAEELKSRTDISDIVGEYVQLRKTGTNYKGLCPFHDEKTPSFVVSPDKGIYKCFGCGRAGNVFTFIMDYLGLSFQEALKLLAEKIGYDLPEYNRDDPKKIAKASHKERLYSLLSNAAGYFNLMLRKNDGSATLKYYRERDFSDTSINLFNLGFAPDSWDSTSNYLISKKFTVPELEDAGMIIKKEDGKYYDRFRNRAIFPIKDFMGRIVGFGARSLEDDVKQAKYINSPQSTIYDKSKILFGLSESKNAVRNSGFVILVEGYADVLTLFQHGIENVAAVSGTALTTDQLALLKRFCNKIYMVFDSDKAGEKAAERSIDLALAREFDVKIVSLPKGEDPDSLVRKHGKNTFMSYINNAKEFFDYKIDMYKLRGMMDNPADRVESVRELVGLVTSIPDKLQHDFYIRKIAPIFELSQDQLRQIYKEKIGKGINPDFQSSRNKAVQGLDEEAANKLIAQRKVKESISSELTSEEKYLIHLMIAEDLVISLLRNELKIEESDFISNSGKRLFTLLIDISENEGDIINALSESDFLDSADRDLLTDLLFSDQISENWPKYDSTMPEKDLNKILKDTINNLRKKSIEKRVNELQSEFSEDMANDKKLVILKLIKELTEKKKSLNSSNFVN